MVAPAVAAVASAGGAAAARTGLKALLARLFAFLLKNPSACYAAYLTTKEVIKSGKKGSVSDGQLSDLIDRYDGLSAKWASFNAETGDITDEMADILSSTILQTKQLQRAMESKFNQWVLDADRQTKAHGMLMRDNIYTILAIVTDAVSERIAFSTRSFKSEAERMVGLATGVEVNAFNETLQDIVKAGLQKIQMHNIDDLIDIAVTATQRLRSLVKGTPQQTLLTSGFVDFFFAKGTEIANIANWAPKKRIPSSRIMELKATPPAVWVAIERNVAIIISNWMKELARHIAYTRPTGLIANLVSHLREQLAMAGIAPVMNVNNLAVLAKLLPFASGISSRDEADNDVGWGFERLSEVDRINRILMKTYDINWAYEANLAWARMTSNQDDLKPKKPDSYHRVHFPTKPKK